MNVFVTCAVKASELGVLDASTARCHRELERVQPEFYPPLREAVASVGWVNVALEGETKK
jgi:hypothetical protein